MTKLLAALTAGLAAAASLFAAERPGLLATYSDARRSVRVETPDANFFLAAEESPHPGIAAAFEAVWRGKLSVLRNGDYRFDAGGAQVALGGKVAADAPLQLAAGSVPLEIRYRRQAGEAQLRLLWKGPGFDWEPLPNRLLSHDESLSAQETLVSEGRRLAGELGCVNCHVSASASLERRLAPELNGIGARRNEGWLFAWMADPRAVRGDAAMPALLTAAERRDIARYLATLQGPRRARAGRQVAQPLPRIRIDALSDAGLRRLPSPRRRIARRRRLEDALRRVGRLFAGSRPLRPRRAHARAVAGPRRSAGDSGAPG